MNPHTITTVKCANCGKVRGESNHWFVIGGIDSFRCWPFMGADFLGPEHKPVCGQSCAQKEFEAWMTRKRNEPEPDALWEYEVKQERHAHSTDSENSELLYSDKGVRE